ncbi:MAG: UDP-glucose 4-epimerase GalE [Gammaproteobacteria bacterium]|jgi:UDP-glucose 4-epimerase
MAAILVTGGAGYIGSHTSLQLIESGHNVVVLDNLYSGHRWAVSADAEFYEGDIADPEIVRDVLARHHIEAVVHFAGHIVVPESVADPLKYYRNNVAGSLNLIQCCMATGVNQFVFSSSAAVYGIPKSVPVAEDADKDPINPYGMTKLMTEWTLSDLAAAEADFRYVALRYFNVAGAHIGGGLGQATPEATHLIKVACQTATGQRPEMSVFGDDYDTVDGTCVRDYIHVDDLAKAHLDALNYLSKGGDSLALNCGYGRGYSVREVIDMVKKVSGVDFKVRQEGRRAGDPAELVANNQQIRHRFKWEPRYADLETICRSAYEWELKLLESGRQSGN